MKLLLAVLCIGVKCSKLLFGSNECMYGPSYWCENLSQAHQCDAKQYCVERTWDAESIIDDACNSCKTAIGLVQMYLSDNKTRTETRNILDAACRVVPDQHIQQKCLNLVKKETDMVFDFIQKTMDPSIICHAIQICRPRPDENVGNVDEKPLDKPQTSISTANESSSNLTLVSESCVLCKIAVAKVDEIIANPDNNGKILDGLEQMCMHLPGEYSDRCQAMVEMYGPQIIKLVEANIRPRVICRALGFCEGSKIIPRGCAEKLTDEPCDNQGTGFYFNGGVQICEQYGVAGCGKNKNQFTTLEDCNAQCTYSMGLTLCQDCKLAIAYLAAYIDDGANDDDIIEVLEKVCYIVPRSFKMECQDIIDVYGTEILNFADYILDSKYVCKRIGLCSTSSL